MSKELLDALSEPFPQAAIKQRQGGGGKMLDYLEGHTIIHRLNNATGGTWDFRVVSLDWRESLLLATVELTIPGLGTRQHIGIQEVKNNSSDLVKGAITDALKKVATLFGVGLSLYGPDFAEEAKPPPPDPRIALLDSLKEQTERLGLSAQLGDGSLKARSKFARTICVEFGRNIDPTVPLIADDIAFAVENLAKWNLDKKAAAIAARPAEAVTPEEDTDPPFEGGALFPAPEPSIPTTGNYATNEHLGAVGPTGGKRKVS